MKIEIVGSRCISCYKYTQYYRRTLDGQFEPINCGFCGIRQRTSRPGDRCKDYREGSNIK